MHPTHHDRRGFRPHRHPHRQPPFARGDFGPGDGPPGPQGFGPRGFGSPGPRGGFGPRGERGRHRGRGTRRGDVRAAVLALLAERPMHGYELIQQIEERSGGVWRPSPGSIYPTLQLLADQDLVSGDESGGRRLFTLTETGKTEAARAAAARAEDDPPWQQERDETFQAAQRFRDELGQLGMAVWQVAQVGTEAQRGEILTVLADARRRAYQLLADDIAGETAGDAAGADPSTAE